MSQDRFIRNMDSVQLQIDGTTDVLTADPNDALQFSDQDAAASRLRRVQHLFPDLSLKEVHYESRAGHWIAVT